jgi:cellulose synthase/poly-beta-1,6-N-acetylglucosamine synthase-like glycosyltransferase
MTPEISVIIPALNEEKYIKRVMDGLGSQSFRSFETIVVDGDSSDNTRKIASRGGKVLIEKKRGPAAARNSGAKAAKGKILLFIDADTVPSKNLLKTYHQQFKDPRTVALTGPILPLEKAGFLIQEGYSFVSMIFVRSSILLRRPCIVGANFAVRKEAFDRVRGFNPEMITYEDWDLSLRLKKLGKIHFIKDATVYTSVRRIKEWGVHGFFNYYIGNMARYTFLKKPKNDYKQIR